MKSTALPPDHYAAGWNTGELRTHAEINSLGKRYAETHDQEALLELCKSFHPYLMKYLVMICRGHEPGEEGQVHRHPAEMDRTGTKVKR